MMVSDLLVETWRFTNGQNTILDFSI